MNRWMAKARQWPVVRAGLLAGWLWAGVATATPAAPLKVSIDEGSGLPVVSLGGEAMTTNTVYWGPKWAWTAVETDTQARSTFEVDIKQRVPSLGLSHSAQARRDGAQALTWQWKLNASQAHPAAIGGGLSFQFDLRGYAAQMGEPSLLPDHRGWAWGRPGQSRVEMRFDPPVAAVEFEANSNKSEIRAYFYRNSIKAGALEHRVTLTVSGDAQLSASPAARFGLRQAGDWPANELDWQSVPVDLSHLNAADRPAGKRGVVRAVDDRLVFADGTPARFWGTNLSAFAVFNTSRDNIQQQARRLSRLGFNLVRLHHHDSHWATPNVFAGDGKASTAKLNPEAMEKLDWWIKSLRDEGIYVWLDLHVGRVLRSADGIEHFNELVSDGRQGDLKGFNYVNRSIQEAMDRFNTAYLTHRNPHTGLRYLEDPAVIAVLLTNENDVTGHFGNSLLPDKNVPRHADLFRAASDQFATTHKLSKDRTMRSWEHGPSKLFLNDLEYGVNHAAIARLRAQGLRAPMASTNAWGNNPLSSLPALLAGELIDAHAYGGVGDVDRDPRFKPNLVHWLASAQIAGRPFSVTEWNAERYPAADRHNLPLYLAASAAHQGWDAVMLYAYGQGDMNGPGSPDNWHALNDPALMVPMAAAAVLYRGAHVREATSVYAFSPSADQLFNQYIAPDSSVALRTAVERGKLVIALPATKELPWMKASPVPEKARVLTDPQASVLPATAGSVRSDNGDLHRDWEHGVFTVNTPRSQSASGWLGGRPQTMAQVLVDLKTPSATVAVQSLDDSPIAESKRLLITTAGVTVPRRSGALPFVSQPLEGQIHIQAPAGLQLFSAGDGRAQRLPSSYAEGRYSIDLSKTRSTSWMILRAP